MGKILIENWYQSNYAIFERKAKKGHVGWYPIGWVKKLKNGTWSAYSLNKYGRSGRLLKSGFKTRKSAVNYLSRRKQ